jgi:4-hydroxybenzoate polyprenyltransferase
VLALARLVHPAPTVAVVALSAALGAILELEAGIDVPSGRLLLITAAVLGSQILTGALNDWADRDRDAIAQPTKPIPAGAASPPAALSLALTGLALQLAASVPLGMATLLLGLGASASAAAYNLWLSRTPASVLPYVVSFGLLPLWVAAGVDVSLDRVAIAVVLVAPFAAAAHLANTLRDFEADARLGARNLAQVLGRRRAFALAWGLALGVGLVVGAALLIEGRLAPGPLGLGAVGIAAILQGARGPRLLWLGMLVAAVAWTAAWALASG